METGNIQSWDRDRGRQADDALFFSFVLVNLRGSATYLLTQGTFWLCGALGSLHEYRLFTFILAIN